MGIFGNILDGLKSASQAVLNDAAKLDGVVGMVAKATKSLLHTDQTIPKFLVEHVIAQINESDTANLGAYHKIFDYVSNRLLEEAKKATVRNPSAEYAKKTVYEDSLVGLWQDPNGLGHDNLPSQAMYQDLSTFMAAMHIPATYKNKEGTVQDTVITVGKALFANLGPEQVAAALDEENPIDSVGVNFSLGDGSFITGSHLCYPIPMGKPGSDHTLHSAIHLQYAASEYGLKAFADTQNDADYTNPLQKKDSWLVTVNVTWASGPTAIGAQKSFRAVFFDNYKQFNLHLSNLRGTLQLVKVQASPNDTPADVRAAVQACALAAVNKPLDKNAEPLALDTPKNYVKIKVNNVSWCTESSIPVEKPQDN